jgi:hypothetical protein
VVVKPFTRMEHSTALGFRVLLSSERFSEFGISINQCVGKLGEKMETSETTQLHDFFFCPYGVPVQIELR